MNVGLGAVKGLEVGTFKPGEFMNRQAKRIGTKGGKLSNFCGHLGTFAGVIVGIAVAVPSLLIGVVGGLIRGVYKTPEAVKTCFNDGCFEAVKRTAHHYKLDAREIVIIVVTALAIGATALLATPLVLISIMTIEAAVIVAPSPFLIAGGALLGYSVGGLTYAAAGTKDDVRKESN